MCRSLLVQERGYSFLLRLVEVSSSFVHSLAIPQNSRSFHSLHLSSLTFFYPRQLLSFIYIITKLYIRWEHLSIIQITMRFSEFMIVPLLAAAVEARACKAKRPTTAALATTAVATSTSPAVTSTAVAASSTVASVSSASSAISSLSSSTSSASSTEAAYTSTSAPPKPTTTSTPPSAPTTLTTAVSSSAKPTSAKPAPTSAPYRAYPADVVDKLRDSSIANLESFTKRNPSSCTLENASIRREW